MKQNSLKTARHVLLFPFELKEDEELNNLSLVGELGNLTITLEKQTHKYILKVEGFETEDDAKEFTNQIWKAFAWLLINNTDGMPFHINLNFGPSYYPTDPKKAAENIAWSFGATAKEGEVVDVVANGDLPIVIRNDQNLSRLFGGKVNFRRTRSANDLIKALANVNNSKRGIDPKLKLALELYNAYFFENSANAKFITLIMVLEALTNNPEKHKVSLELIEKWKEELTKERVKFYRDSVEYESLTALERELLFRRKASLTSQIRAVITESLKENGEQAKEYAKQAVEMYNLRGTLVHEGWLPQEKLDAALETTKKIVVAVLKAKLQIVIS